MSNKNNLLNQAQFVYGVPNPNQLPTDLGREVAFVGRSNSGKSSTLNALTGKKIARTSKTPGRTQAINVFQVAENKRLVDLPGYGYAKVSKTMRAQWDVMMERYLCDRNSLIGLVLIMDVRHPFTEMDKWLLNWCEKRQLNVQILLNKSDKLSRNQQQNTRFKIKKEYPEWEHSFCLFSSVDAKIGHEETLHIITNWLNHN